MVEQTPRRGNEQLAPATQGIALGVDIDPAEHHGRAQRRVLAVACHVFVHLVGQFARGGENERTHRVPRRRRTGVGELHEPVKDGQRERRRFTRACLGGAHDIPAIHDVRNGSSLDGGGRGVARFGDGLENTRVQAEIGEGGSSGFCGVLCSFCH